MSASPPLSPVEVSAWLDSLAKSNGTRRAKLQELLRYAGEDLMSAEDRKICTMCLREVEKRMKAGMRSN